MSQLKISKRKRVNFMVDEEILKHLNEHCHSGDRSDYVNRALEESIKLENRRKAFELSEAFIKKHRIKMTTAEIIKAKNYGRK